ncbi:MAG: NAD-dependent epimerase/dehydratase family protein [Candidatus Eisenbacteria sp.]|nr:NAD-dependent epimerase/dehydratase family protein [Candidatus Eisenbacteria bacterium]
MNFERILVTGGAGFVGSHLVDALIDRGVDVVVVDNLSTGVRENLDPKAEFVKCDVRDHDAIKKVVRSGVDAVIHLAARVSVRSSVEGFLDDAQTNVLGTLTLLDAVRGSGVRKFIYASSMAVYADGIDRSPIPEIYPKGPPSPYGVAKLTCERYLELLQPSLGIRIAALRYFNVYGPRQGYTPYVGVITIFSKELLNGRPPVIFGDGEQTRDFVSVRDIVNGTLLALEADIDWDIFNIGSGRGWTVNEIARMLIERIRPGTIPESAPARPEEMLFSVADLTKSESVLGYEPKGMLEEDIDEIIEWCRERFAK